MKTNILHCNENFVLVKTSFEQTCCFGENLALLKSLIQWIYATYNSWNVGLHAAGAAAYERRVSSVSTNSDNGSTSKSPTGSANCAPSTFSQLDTSRTASQQQKSSTYSTNYQGSYIADDSGRVVGQLMLTEEQKAKLHYEDVGQTVPQDDQWALLLREDANSDRLEPKLLGDSVRKGEVHILDVQAPATLVDTVFSTFKEEIQ